MPLSLGRRLSVTAERNMSRTDMRGTAHPAGVGEHITREEIASEPGRSRVWPSTETGGPHREDEESKPMMHGRGKSGEVVVARKPVNKAERSVAEPVERRAEAEGNASQQSTFRAQSREDASQALERIRQRAKEKKEEKFISLLHHIDPELLEEAFYERKLADLHARVHRGAYRAPPSRRVYIPKPDGRQRPLAVAAIEDKIVQRAAAVVLNAIYEADFLGFSYGFRPGRGAHDAMDALVVAIESKQVNFILDADVQ